MATTSLPNSALVVSTVSEMTSFLSSISPGNSLYIDLEGNNLSRHGNIAIVTILIHPQDTVYLIDISVLGALAFNIPSDDGRTLQSIFEDPVVPKHLWDVRNDADALWAHYHVDLKGVVDIQLLENASRTSNKTFIRGLDKCVEYDLRNLKTDDVLRLKREMHASMNKDREMHASMPRDFFDVRPLDPKTIQYCVNDVLYLPALQAFYMKRIAPKWQVKAIEESARRVVEAHSAGYDPQGENKRKGPWGAGSGMREW
jgi:exonuclease 3'-5' domain-containing protein 1